MLSKDPKDQLQEIEAGLRHTKESLANFEAMVGQYHGPFWSSGAASNDFSPENHYFQYLSYIVPECAFSNPRAKATTKKLGEGEPDAEAIQLGLNRTIRDANLRKLLVKLCVDQGFTWGVALTTQEPERSGVDLDDPPFRPQSRRIPQKQYFEDPLATDEESVRFRGHAWVADLEDLKQRAEDHPDEGWLTEQLALLTTGTETDRLARREEYERSTPDRKEVILYDLWVPEHTYEAQEGESQDDFSPANGFHGVIYTVVSTRSRTEGELGSASWIRKPRPYYGPRWGPYTVFGTYYVPNSSKWLGALTAADGQIREHNAHAKAISKSSSRYKRLLLVDELDPDLNQRIADAPDSMVIPVAGLNNDKVVEAEVGGTTQVELAQNQVMAERTEKALGMNDALRGSVTGVGTATENQLAASAASSRIGFIKQQFNDSVLQLLKTWAWYLHEDDRVIFNLGEEAAKALDEPGPYVFFGGHPSKERTARIKEFFKREYPGTVPPEEVTGTVRSSFDDLDLEIEVYSMERTNPVMELQRVTTAFQMLQAAASNQIQLPNGDWVKALNLVGDALNMPDLGSLLNAEIGEELAAAMLQLQVQSATNAPGEGRQQQRLQRDVMQPASKPGGAGHVSRPPSAGGRIADMVPAGMPGRAVSNGNSVGAKKPSSAGSAKPSRNGSPR